MRPRRRPLALLAALAALVLWSGCTFEPVKLGSSAVVPHDPSQGREISARACGFMLGGVIPIAMSNRDQRAFRALTDQAHGDYVAGIQAEQHLTYAFVGWTICTTFYATAYPRV